MTERYERDRTDLGLTPADAEFPSGHSCRHGWIGDEDHPAPCPTCRPHLRRDRDGWRINPNRLPTDRKDD